MKLFNRNLKAFLKKFLNLDIRGFFKYLKKKYSAFDAYLVIRRYVNFDNGFIIDCGANDGITNSNSYYLEKKRNWKCLLIEPSKKFKKLTKIRNNKLYHYNNASTSFKNDGKNINFAYLGLMTTVLNKAIATKINEDTKIKKEDVSSTAWEILKSSTSCTDFTNIDTDIPDSRYFFDAGKKHLKNHGENYHTFSVKGKSITSMLDEIKAPNIIDFFSLDVEGMTIEVLEGVDFNKYTFKYIFAESYDFNKVSNF